MSSPLTLVLASPQSESVPTSQRPAARSPTGNSAASDQKLPRWYVYVWVDGIHLKVRLEADRVCLLVMIGVRADGTKELVASLATLFKRQPFQAPSPANCLPGRPVYGFDERRTRDNSTHGCSSEALHDVSKLMRVPWPGSPRIIGILEDASERRRGDAESGSRRAGIVARLVASLERRRRHGSTSVATPQNPTPSSVDATIEVSVVTRIVLYA